MLIITEFQLFAFKINLSSFPLVSKVTCHYMQYVSKVMEKDEERYCFFRNLYTQTYPVTAAPHMTGRRILKSFCGEQTITTCVFIASMSQFTCYHIYCFIPLYYFTSTYVSTEYAVIYKVPSYISSKTTKKKKLVNHPPAGKSKFKEYVRVCAWIQLAWNKKKWILTANVHTRCEAGWHLSGSNHCGKVFVFF